MELNSVSLKPVLLCSLFFNDVEVGVDSVFIQSFLGLEL